MAAGDVGQMLTYKAGNRLVPGVPFAIDNGVVRLVDGQPVNDPAWSPDRWVAYLRRYQGTPGCLFAVVPDVVGDHQATMTMWRRWAPAVSRHGYTAAFVAQDGCNRLPAGAEVVFIGGSTAWKDGPDAMAVARVAVASGRRVHLGRVNTLRRLQLAKAMGASSVDGTLLARGPDINLPVLRGFLRRVNAPQLPLESTA